MRPESAKLLWGAATAAGLVLAFVRGRTFQQYAVDPMVRSAVERQLMIVGEALAQLRRTDPACVDRIPDAHRVVAFRNVLVHGYAVVDDRIVWGVIESDLRPLRDALLDLLGPTPTG